MKQERLKIGLTHLGISATVTALFLALIFGIWYLGIMPSLFGLGKIIAFFVVGNIVIFPALSTLICKKDKKEQKRDLTILAIMQTSISVVMLYFIFQTRPVWVALVIDDFEIVRANDVQSDEKQGSALTETGFFTSYKLVGASFSKDPNIAKEQKTRDMFGKSVAWYPATVVPLSEKTETLKDHALPLTDLKKYNPETTVADILKKYPQAKHYFPLRGFVKDGAVLANQDFTWFQAVDLWPWERGSLFDSPEEVKDKK